jgi:hypothetical protein
MRSDAGLLQHSNKPSVRDILPDTATAALLHTARAETAAQQQPPEQ